MTDSLTEKFNISVHVDLKMEINPTLRKKKWSQNGSTLEPFWRTVPTLRVELFFSLIIMFKPFNPYSTEDLGEKL